MTNHLKLAASVNTEFWWWFSEIYNRWKLYCSCPMENLPDCLADWKPSQVWELDLINSNVT